MASVSFESFIKKQSIEIPAIQRDYVQGRGFTVDEQDKREAFVSRLITAIADENAKPCHLEFIYGAVNDTSHCFIPLDGQQRLTTLFLFHWVIWNMSSVEVKSKYPLKTISGFKYQTRLSSLSFCENVISKKLLQVEGVNTLGEKLKKQPWFSEDWIFDPSIQSMISMIDFMEEKLKRYSEEEISTMLEKICGEANTISFDELNMSDYDLTDSLYIKMNARGKHLTPFENWKSDFIKYLEMKFGKEDYPNADKSRKSMSFSYKDYFCHSIEHQWTDLFWTYLKKEYMNLDEQQQQKQYPAIDKMFMNFFDFLCMYHYYVQGTSQGDYTMANAATKRKIWQNVEFINFFFGALDSLCRIDHKTFFDNLFYISDKELSTDNVNCKVRLFRTKQCNLFKLCVDNGSSMELTDMLLFYALLYYCQKKNVNGDVDDNIKLYMRNIRNYFETDIQNIKTRTTVQLNLRVSEFIKYDIKIKELAETPFSPLTVSRCVIDDCSITHGNTSVFEKSVKDHDAECVVKALEAFCNASQNERVRILIANGFKGTYLSDCIGRNRYFFGNKDKWDVLFVSDKEQLSTCFHEFTSKIKKGETISTIIQNAREKHSERFDFIYYMLTYDYFLDANDSQHHFAIKGEIDDVDWIALGSYSSNPGTAYHTDPLATAVEKELIQKHPYMNLSLYKQYSGKCPLSIVNDKVHWEPIFSVISRKDGWHVICGINYITEDLQKEFRTRPLPEENSLLIPTDKRDMVRICIDLMEKVSKCIENNPSCSTTSPTPPTTPPSSPASNP